jgi:hypothetical protein
MRLSAPRPTQQTPHRRGLSASGPIAPKGQAGEFLLSGDT